MILKNRFANNPRILMTIGMACLLLASLPRFVRMIAPGLIPASSPLSPDQADFAHGLFIGLSIGFNLLVVWKTTHKNNCAS
jgi:hypothetical protein